MKLEKIITLCNKNMELRFLAMLRSLRATGCNLPVWVIPYDDKKFELPENCIWWETEEVLSWLGANNAGRMMKKYQCLLTSNYQYVDTDVVFLRNPETLLADYSGFIASCGHWHNPGETYSEESLGYFKMHSTTWQKHVFNAGQFACDKQLYDIHSLKKVAEDPMYRYTCLDFPFEDQCGLNLLVHLEGITVTNLTLPPTNMQSTWAGDYGANYTSYWISEQAKPYIIHWAGCKMNENRPIDALFYEQLSTKEKAEWDESLLNKVASQNTFYKKMRRNLRQIKRAIDSVKFE